MSTKSDLDLEQQRYLHQPDAYCRALGLAVPISVSIKEKMYADLFHLLVGVAIDPSVAIPGSRRRGLGRVNIGLGVGVVGVVVAAFFVYRWRNT